MSLMIPKWYPPGGVHIRRERSDRSGVGQESPAGAHHRVPPWPERSTDRARTAVGWIASDVAAVGAAGPAAPRP